MHPIVTHTWNLTQRQELLAEAARGRAAAQVPAPRRTRSRLSRLHVARPALRAPQPCPTC